MKRKGGRAVETESEKKTKKNRTLDTLMAIPILVIIALRDRGELAERVWLSVESACAAELVGGGDSWSAWRDRLAGDASDEGLDCVTPSKKAWRKRGRKEGMSAGSYSSWHGLWEDMMALGRRERGGERTNRSDRSVIVKVEGL
jgi:hypothetical protein